MMNADYGTNVSHDMSDLETAMVSCKDTTFKVVGVSEELVEKFKNSRRCVWRNKDHYDL